ncbi:hypothetical protein FRC10_004748, partial [Ceratobasidium sp. 414]
MSRASAGSTKSYAASEICKNEEKFSVWAKEIPVVYEPRIWKRIPDGPIASMVQGSQRLPEWLFQKVALAKADSSEYKMFEKLYPNQVRELVTLGPAPKNTTPDSSIATDLIYAMPHIINIVRRHRILQHNAQFPFNEADVRQPLDHLACHVWEPDSKNLFRFRSECPLKLPQTKTYPIPKAIVDSVSFFVDPEPEYSLLMTNASTMDGMRCMVNLVAPMLALVHWVTEYKGETSKLQDVKRQVYYGIVSGLWQRRILGRMDDYVFGTAQAGSEITVYAARWEKRSTDSKKKGDSDMKPKSPVPAATRSNTSNKSSK